MSKGLWTLIGFIIFALGFIAIILSIVGAKLAILLWVDAFGGLVGFVVKLLMVLLGAIIMIVSRSDFKGEGHV